MSSIKIIEELSLRELIDEMRRVLVADDPATDLITQERINALCRIQMTMARRLSGLDDALGRYDD